VDHFQVSILGFEFPPTRPIAEEAAPWGFVCGSTRTSNQHLLARAWPWAKPGGRHSEFRIPNSEFAA
jgi:hypothetical protein